MREPHTPAAKAPRCLVSAAPIKIRLARRTLCAEPRHYAPRAHAPVLLAAGSYRGLARYDECGLEETRTLTDANRARSGHFSITCIASPDSRGRETVIALAGTFRGETAASSAGDSP